MMNVDPALLKIVVMVVPISVASAFLEKGWKRCSLSSGRTMTLCQRFADADLAAGYVRRAPYTAGVDACGAG